MANGRNQGPIPTAPPVTKNVTGRSLVLSIDGPERPYDVYRFSGGPRYERPNHNPFTEEALAGASATLPTGVVGQEYATFTLSASNGVSPLTWTVVSGALPAGLTLSSDGRITGTPTDETGSPFGFTARVTDANASTSDVVLSIPVIRRVEISLNPLYLPRGTVGEVYPTQTFTASGGTGPYTFAIVEGHIHDGLTFTAGVIDGTPTNALNRGPIRVQVTDANGWTDSIVREIQVDEAAPVEEGVSGMAETTYETGIVYGFPGGNLLEVHNGTSAPDTKVQLIDEIGGQRLTYTPTDSIYRGSGDLKYLQLDGDLVAGDPNELSGTFTYGTGLNALVLSPAANIMDFTELADFEGQVATKIAVWARVEALGTYVGPYFALHGGYEVYNAAVDTQLVSMDNTTSYKPNGSPIYGQKIYEHPGTASGIVEVEVDLIHLSDLGTFTNWSGSNSVHLPRFVILSESNTSANIRLYEIAWRVYF